MRRLGTLGQVLDRRPRLPPVGVEPVHGLLVGPDAARVRDGQIRQRRARREQLVRGQRLSGKKLYRVSVVDFRRQMTRRNIPKLQSVQRHQSWCSGWWSSSSEPHFRGCIAGGSACPLEGKQNSISLVQDLTQLNLLEAHPKSYTWPPGCAGSR